MKTQTKPGRKITFRALGRAPVTGVVRNPEALLGTVAAKVASRLGIAGSFEILDDRSEVLSPQTPLKDLPEREEAEYTLASELTPA